MQPWACINHVRPPKTNSLQGLYTQKLLYIGGCLIHGVYFHCTHVIIALVYVFRNALCLLSELCLCMANITHKVRN